VLALGASGAVFAMVSAVLVLSLLARDWPQWEGDAQRWFNVSLAALALNLVSAVGFSSLIQGARLDHWAHGGGAMCGLLLALAPALAGMGRLGDSGREGPDRRKLAFWTTAAVLTASAAAVIFSRGSSPFQ
jgi:membrane associated rhomboid family serine protease